MEKRTAILAAAMAICVAIPVLVPGPAQSASETVVLGGKGFDAPNGASARAPRGQRREQLLAAIKANPGARPAELAGAIGIKPAQVHNLIGRARADKVIAKRGKGYVIKS